MATLPIRRPEVEGEGVSDAIELSDKQFQKEFKSCLRCQMNFKRQMGFKIKIDFRLYYGHMVQ